MTYAKLTKKDEEEEETDKTVHCMQELVRRRRRRRIRRPSMDFMVATTMNFTDCQALLMNYQSL